MSHYAEMVKKLPFDQFLKTFELVPRVAVNLLVVGRDGEILLTKRKKPPFAGVWHLPGSFLLKGEGLLECSKRVAKEELGVEIEKEIERGQTTLAGVFDDLDGDPRGHVVDVVYRCEIGKGLSFPYGKDSPLEAVGDTAEMRFFKKLPKNIGFNHRDTLALLGYT